jgi:eukaryotic-like serine/threonine-protein kinase
VSTPFTQPIEVKAQQQLQVALPFHKALGTIKVHTPAGTAVTLDGAAAGQAGQDGTLVIGKVAQGSHSVAAQVGKASLHQDVVIDDKNVATVRDVSLVPAAPVNGVLVLQVNPTDAQVSVFGGNNQKLPASGNHIEAPAGKYRIEASAFGYASRSVSVDVAAGQTVPVDVALAPANVAAGGPTMNGWDSGQWSLNAKAHTITHTATDIGFYGTKPEIGTYMFSGPLGRSLLLGWQKVQWVVGYRDPDNYMLFALSHESLSVTSVVAGKKATTEQFTLHNKGSYQVMLRVGADEVSLLNREDGKWSLVHSWIGLKQDLNNGGFGFKDAVTLTGFSYSR